MTKLHTRGTGRHPHLAREWTRDACSLFSEITFLCEENRGGIGIARDAPQEMAKVTWLK